MTTYERYIMPYPVHYEQTVTINSDRDLLEFPLCESEKDYNSGRWTEDIDAVTCPECLAIYDSRP